MTLHKRMAEARMCAIRVGIATWRDLAGIFDSVISRDSVMIAEQQSRI